MNLRKFGGLKGSFLKIINEITELSRHYSSDLPISDELKNVISLTISEIGNSDFIVAVVGVIKRGKSTLLNALLETDVDILSMKVTPETARLSYLIYSEEQFAVIHHLDGNATEISFDKLPEYTSSYSGIFPKGKKEKVLNTKYAEIHYPNEYLQQGIILVDTPGVDDPEPARSEVTENFISDADAVIFMVDATEGGLKASELSFMMKRIINNKDKSKGIICVVNKINALRRHQRSQLQDVVDKTRETVLNKLGIEIPIYTIDALDALEGKRNHDEARYEKSLFIGFKEAIEKYLIRDKGIIKLRRVVTSFQYGYISNIIDRVQFDLSIKPENLVNLEKQLDDAELWLNNIKLEMDRHNRQFISIRNNLKIWIEKETKDEFTNQIYISEQNFRKIPSSVLRSVGNLKDRFSQKIKNTFIEIESNLNTSQIRIPQIVFDIKSPSVSLERYLSKEKMQVKKNPGASAIGGWVGGLIGFFTAGILTPVGAYLGYKIGRAFEGEAETREIEKFDVTGLTKEVNEINRNTSQSFISQVDLYFDAFESSIKSWFDSQEATIREKRTYIEKAKDSAEFYFNQKRKRLEEYLKSLKDIENKISLLMSELENNNAS
ncbi:MAG: dynamin family protein [Bacteroidetes bacterium]|nr:dynamin family protein [Bacteroidota bacterium]